MKLFADRGFIAINGIEVVDLTSISVQRNNNAQPVATMSRNRRNAGFNYGNIDITIDLEMAIQRNRSQIDLGIADEGADIKIVLEVGGDRYSYIGCTETSTSHSASVGSASKSMQLLAIDFVNENGDSVNTDFSLG